MSPWVPRALIVLVAAGVLGAIISISVGEGGPRAIQVEGADETIAFYADTAIPQDGARLGPAEALVEIELFTDLRATQSADYQREVVRPLVEEYVKTDRAQIAMRHRSVGASEVSLPAVAATAAGNQGRQWEFADLVLQNLDAAGPQGADEEFLEDVANTLRGKTQDFDAEEWLDDFESPAAEEQPRADNELATELRLPAQPALVVTGPGGSETLVDAPTLADARAAIERVAVSG
jgi:predicted DsbA family dithiol-disulfide isomerase